MGAITRFSDIINSNINAILEKAEEPRKMVRLAIREMQDTLYDIRSTSARYMAERKSLVKQLARHEHDSREWESRAELAITRGRDDLARAAIVKRNEHDAAATAVQAEIEQLDAASEKLKVDANTLEDKLTQAKARRNALVLRGETARSRIRIKRALHDPAHGQAIARFEAYERRLDELEGECEAFDLGNATLSDEIAALEADTALTAELEALKSRMTNLRTLPVPSA